nr:D-alanyl-D-alanine carboxypeptidase family protein [Cochlodiniinecator piscidefendens]
MLHRLILQTVTACVFVICALPTHAFDTRATAAYVIDVTNDTVLMEKNAQVALPPASMSKLMTINMLYEALRDGRVALETRMNVSTRAEAMTGSSMFLTTRDRPTVEELLQGIIVQSGNDACVVVAEGLGGTEQAFAEMMTNRANALGMYNSSFANASGWPAPAQRMSMEDLGLLATRLINEFPEYYHYFSQQRFEFDGRVPQNHNNRNPLLRLNIGADGLKTGHTSEAGYGLVGSARQGNRRIVFVITGLQSELERAEEAERIVNWAFRQFSQRQIADEGVELARADVWLGAERDVAVVTPEALTMLLPASVQGGVSGEVVFQSPIVAPITAGQTIADFVVARDGLPDVSYPLVAANAVDAGGFVTRVLTSARVLINRVQNTDETAPEAVN